MLRKLVVGVGVLALLLTAVTAQAQAPGGAAPAATAVKVADLPQPVVDAVKAAYPKAAIQSALEVKRRQTTSYRLQVAEEGKSEVTLNVNADGQIASASMVVKVENLSKEVAAAVATAAPDYTIASVARTETFMGRNGKLEKPTVGLVFTLTGKDNVQAMLTVDEQGKVVRPLRTMQPRNPPAAPAPAPAPEAAPAK